MALVATLIYLSQNYSYYIWGDISPLKPHRSMCLVQWLKLSARKVGDRGLEPRSGIQASKKQNAFPRSLVKIQYCGESQLPRGSVVGLRSPGLEFRSLCLEGSVMSLISPSSGGFLGPM